MAPTTPEGRPMYLRDIPPALKSILDDSARALGQTLSRRARDLILIGLAEEARRRGRTTVVDLAAGTITVAGAPGNPTFLPPKGGDPR